LESGELARVMTVPVLVWNPPAEAVGSAVADTRPTGEFKAMPREAGKRLPNAMVYELGQATARMTVGRGDDCTIKFPSDSVSRMHLQLNLSAQGWSVCDLGSRNGTWVGTARIQPGAHVLLTDGVRLQLGDVELFFMLPASFCDYVAQVRSAH
jgi:predicted component of type VI protein secretion system